MPEYSLGVVEARFADIIWENEPVSSAQIVKFAEKELNWKKSTTYTVLKRLCDKGIFKNENGTVKRIITREEFYSMQSERFVDETFSGSLPAFLAAFTSRKKLAEDEVKALRRMLDEYSEE